MLEKKIIKNISLDTGKLCFSLILKSNKMFDIFFLYVK